MIAHVHRRDRCRACGGCDLERVLRLPFGPERLTSMDPVDELVVCSPLHLHETRAQNVAFTERGGRIISVADLLGPTELRAAA